MRVAAHGITADLPDRWEGAIRAEREDALSAAAAGRGAPTRSPTCRASACPAAAVTSAAVRSRRWAGTTTSSRSSSSVRHEAHSPLFAATGLPRRLDPRRFSPRALQRMLPGQTGMQHFFTAGGRAFCLYVVLGDRDDAHLHVRRVERVLARLTIQDRT
jgi:hypothetical protein